MIKRATQTAKWIVPVVVAVFIGRSIVTNWSQVREAEWALEPGWLALSFILCSGWYWARPMGWSVALNGFGRPVPFRPLFRLYRRAEMSRFVPGAVWQFVSRVYLIKRWGVAPAACLAATLIDFVLAMLAAVPLAALRLADALPMMRGYLLWAFVVFPFGALAVVHPKILNFWAGFTAKILKQPYQKLDISWARLGGVWLMYALAWAGWAFGAACFVRGVVRIDAGDIPIVASSYALSWLSAMLTMISPAGMGIREALLGLLLEPVLPRGAALTVAVGIRLWMTFCEVVWTLVGEHLARAVDPPTAEEPC